MLTPFSGIEPKHASQSNSGRRAVGIELQAVILAQRPVNNLTELESEMDAPSLFDTEALCVKDELSQPLRGLQSTRAGRLCINTLRRTNHSQKEFPYRKD